MENKEGILLLFVSDYKENSERATEFSICGKKYAGRQTNEAPCNYLFDKAKEEGFPIKKVICLGTKKVMDLIDDSSNKLSYENEVKKISARSLFAKRFMQYASTLGMEDIHFYGCQVMEQKKIEERALHIIQRINEILSESDSTKRVYIDYTGGKRDISFLMISIIRFMEFKGIECGKVVYGNKADRDNESELADISFVYDVFKLINAINDFITMGNAAALNRFYAIHSDNDDVNALIISIREFADSLILCDTEGINSKIKRIIVGLKNIEGKMNCKELYPHMFIMLMNTIEKKMYLEGGDIEEKLEKDDPVIYTKLIRWCIDNGMIQQALTLYVEKMPFYYFEKTKAFVNSTFNIDVVEELKKMEKSDIPAYYYDEMYRIVDKDQRLLSKVEIILREITDKYKNGMHVFVKKDEYCARLFNSCKKSCEKEVQEKLDIIKKQIRENFDADGKRIPSGSIRQKSIDKYLNVISQGNTPELQKMLFGSVIAAPTNDKALSVTYKRKKDCLEAYYHYIWQNDEEGIDQERHIFNFDFLSYYLAVKILRNRINHAAEEKQEIEVQYEKEAIMFLKEKANVGFDERLLSGEKMSGVDRMNCISSLLLKGIERAEAAF